MLKIYYYIKDIRVYQSTMKRWNEDRDKLIYMIYKENTVP